jgi:hypothetical protein
MAAADRPRNEWRTLPQAAEPRGIFDARRNALIPPSKAEVEKRRHEIVYDLRAGRRWRVRWRDSEGCWQVGGIPAHWWRNYDDIDWVWSTLARPDGLLRVEIYDADAQLVVSEPSPPAGAVSKPTVDPYSTGTVGRRTVKHFVLAEAKQRLSKGKSGSLKDFAIALEQWAVTEHPVPPAPHISANRIEEVVRGDWNKTAESTAK